MLETLEILGLPGYPSEIGKALWQLEDCRSRTLRVLEGLPEEFLDHEVQGMNRGAAVSHCPDRVGLAFHRDPRRAGTGRSDAIISGRRPG
jgi:hypothetical protein